MGFTTRSLLSSACSFLLLATASAYTPQMLAQQRTTPTSTLLPPSTDPFYTAPVNFEAAAPGAILRMRAAPGNLTAKTANCSAAYNILYRTTDSQYKPTWAVTTLFVPTSSLSRPAFANDTNGANNELLSYQIPYDSADVDASPSYALNSGVVSDIPFALGLGWFVNVPDYEGPLASFTAGVISGHATLDSVRAVLNAGFGLSKDAKYALWGYSGGALASEWAAELQVQYAPELAFAGAALGGLTPNITSVLFAVNGQATAGLIPSGILGILGQYPDAFAQLQRDLKPSGPYNATRFLSARNMTLVETIGAFVGQDITQYFSAGAATLQMPIYQRAINRDGIMGTHGTPQMPLYVYKAIADEVSPVADTDKLVDAYCAAGADIWYQRNTEGTHGSEATYERTAALEFLVSVFDGVPHKGAGCLIENVTTVTGNPP